MGQIKQKFGEQMASIISWDKLITMLRGEGNGREMKRLDEYRRRKYLIGRNVCLRNTTVESLPSHVNLHNYRPFTLYILRNEDTLKRLLSRKPTSQ